jgi:hypothetical protein
MRHFRVFSLDMWGHVPADCCVSYGCNCVKVSEDGWEHDDDRCSCHEDCNQQFLKGEITVDGEIIRTLQDEGYLSDGDFCLEDYQNGEVEIFDKEGRRIFHLEEDDS